MKPIRILIAVFSVLVLVCLTYADTIFLVDGRSFKGKFVKGDSNTIVFQSGGKTTNFPMSLVSSVTFGEQKSSGEEAGVKAKEAEAQSKGTELKGKGTLKGVVLYYHNRYLGSRPDIGAEVYACRTKINIDGFKGSLYKSNEIEDFVKTCFMYTSAKTIRSLMNIDPSRFRTEKYTEELKELGADTEAGWEALRNRGWGVLFDLKHGKIPSKNTTIGGDGTFSLELPAGYYFVILKSKNRSLEDEWKCVTITNNETTNISVEFR